MKYSLTADPHTWWLPAAGVGAIGAVALGAILILPTAGQPAPGNKAPDTFAPSAPFHEGAGRYCFMQRPQQYTGDYQLPQPDCR